MIRKFFQSRKGKIKVDESNNLFTPKKLDTISSRIEEKKRYPRFFLLKIINLSDILLFVLENHI